MSEESAVKRKIIEYQSAASARPKLEIHAVPKSLLPSDDVLPSKRPPSKPLEMKTVLITVRITGRQVCTSTTLTIFNPNDQPFEATIGWPVADGTHIGGFALDVMDGKFMRDAVPVEKQKARIAFETEVRKQKDPALIEHVSGNVYKARVYPVGARGSRTIRIDAFGDLIRNERTSDAIYRCPLPFEALIVPQVGIDFAVDQAPTDDLPIVLNTHEEKESLLSKNLKFQHCTRVMASGRTTNQFLGAFSMANVEMPSELLVRLPNYFLKSTLVTITNGPTEKDSDAYFIIDDFVNIVEKLKSMEEPENPVPNNHDKKQKLEPKQKRYAMIWDASESRSYRNFILEDTFVHNLVDGLAKRAAILDVFVFQNVCQTPQMFNFGTESVIGSIPDKSKACCIEFLTKKITYDGATRIDSFLKEAKFQAMQKDYSAIILMTDGISNLGDPETLLSFARRDPNNIPISTVMSSTTADYDFLRAVSSESHGEFVDLTLFIDESSQKDIITAILDQASHERLFRLMDISYDPKKVHSVFVKANNNVLSDSITITGRLKHGISYAMMTISYGQRGVITYTRHVELVRLDTIGEDPNKLKLLSCHNKFDLTARYWAAQKITELQLNMEKNNAEILRMSRIYGLVSKNTSLLVLETPEQYIEHHVDPPTTEPALREAVLALRKRQEIDDTKKRYQRVCHVQNEWKTKRLDWYSTWDAKPRPTEEQDAKDEAKEEADILARKRMEEKWIHDQQHLGIQNQNQYESGVPLGLAPASMMGLGPSTSTLPIPGPASAGSAASAAYHLDRDVCLESKIVTLKSMDESSKESKEQVQAKIIVKPWDPNVPYLDGLKEILNNALIVPKPEEEEKEKEKLIQRKIKISDQLQTEYFIQKTIHGSTPAFFFDVAGLFLDHAMDERNLNEKKSLVYIGARILTNVFEFQLEDPRVARSAAYRLLQAHRLLGDPQLLELAIELLERVLRLRSEEPQSRRDLALALIQHAWISEEKTRNLLLTRAIDLFLEIIVQPYDDRFHEFELTVLDELNNLLGKMKLKSIVVPGLNPRALLKSKIGFLDKELESKLDLHNLFQEIKCDIRITMSWDTDDTDQDLHVYEAKRATSKKPEGEHVYYGYRLSKQGGSLSRDFRGEVGLGPEEYLLCHGRPGKYTVKAKFFRSNNPSTLTGSTILYFSMFTNFGRSNEACQVVCKRMDKTDQVVGHVDDQVYVGDIELIHK